MMVNTVRATATATPRSRRWLAFIGVTGLGLAGLAVWHAWPLPLRSADAPQAIASSSEVKTVTALGRLEPAGALIQVTAPTSAQESRIQQLTIQVGDRVEAGQTIAVLANRDRLAAALKTAEEQVQTARAQLAQVQAGAKSGELQAQQAEIARLEAERAGNLSAQQAAIARLEAEVKNAQTESQRYNFLYEQGAVSASARDAKQLTAATAQRQLQEAQAGWRRIQTASQQQIARARATLTQLAEVRPVDVAAAAAEVQAALAAAAEAAANLAQADVRAPQAGQVIEIHTQPGEQIAEQGIATLGQTQQMMAIAEVYQSDIPQIQTGQRAAIASPVLPDTLAGAVERIGLQVGQQQVVNEDPAANIDAKVVEVHIRLDETASALAAGLTHLQVAVEIQTD